MKVNTGPVQTSTKKKKDNNVTIASSSPRVSHTLLYSTKLFSIFNRVCHYLPSTVKPLENYCAIQTLPKQESEFHYCYIAHSGYAHKPNKELIEPFGFKALDLKYWFNLASDKVGFQLEVLEGSIYDKKQQAIKTDNCIFDRQTGLKIVVSVSASTKEIILAFGDANSMVAELNKDAPSTKRSQRLAVLANLCGWGNPEIYLRGNTLAMYMITTLKGSYSYSNYKITLTGQSLGGTLAQYVGLRNGIPAFCYNAVPLGRKLQESIGHQNLSNAKSYVTHLSVSWDCPSDVPMSGITSFLLNCLTVRTPGNFGQRFCIPTAYYNPFSIHSYVSGSFVKSLGYSERVLPKNLQAENEKFLNTLQNKQRFMASREYKNATSGKLLLKLSEVHVQYLLRIQQENEIDIYKIALFFLISICLYLFGPENKTPISIAFSAYWIFKDYIDNNYLS